MENPKTKELLLNEFAEMRALEASARDFYAKVSDDQNVENAEVRGTFKGISSDEERHVKLVEKIIHITKNNL